jgi:hypothetical protein
MRSYVRDKRVTCPTSQNVIVLNGVVYGSHEVNKQLGDGDRGSVHVCPLVGINGCPVTGREWQD